MELAPSQLPQAFAALEGFPALSASVAPGLRLQGARVAACLARARPRPAALAALDAAIAAAPGGVVALEGPPGSGVTSLLATLAALRPYPLWLTADDAGRGAVALYAQIVALRRTGIPLIDPAAASDPTATERLLAEVAIDPGQPPLVLLVDWPDVPGQPARPLPPPLPADLPPGVTLVIGCQPGAPLPLPPAASVRLPDDDAGLAAAQLATLAALRSPPATAAALVAASGGNFLFLELAQAMARAGLLGAALPLGLDALLAAWWAEQAPQARQLASMLAAAGEPLPLALAAELLAADPTPTLRAWAALGIVMATAQAEHNENETGSPLRFAFAHSALTDFLARVASDSLTAAHTTLATAGLDKLGSPGNRPAESGNSGTAAYLARQLARHATLAGGATSAAARPLLVSREWLRASERRDGPAGALRDVAWEFRAAAAGPPLRLAYAAAMVGNLATRARALSPAAAVDALLVGVERSAREGALKRVLALVERLADGLDKAQILRQLGEACYGARMRTSAMRLLSRALDLEAQPASRAWRDQREQLLAALACAALETGAVDQALTIAERIGHLERRAQVETLVARHLLAAGDLARAQRVARGILHESMGAWSRAEVGVALLRSGDRRGEMLLEEISTETVAAWAQIELACDQAAGDETAALRRVEALPTAGQRDRGLARLAHALALADKDGDAFAAAERIAAVEVRVAALIDLLILLEGLVAMLALERAISDIAAVTGDDRAPLLSALAAALAALGRHERALRLIEPLPPGEERDRALARVAVALAKGGDHARSRELLAELSDEDERDWARDEIAREFATAGRWEEARALAGAVCADEQRARTAADLAIERARGGHPLPALGLALAVELAAERARALTLIVPYLVADGQAAAARAVLDRPGTLVGPEVRARYQAALVAALAHGNQLDLAAEIAGTILRPAERARAELSLALPLASADPQAAQAALGRALRAAVVGREELFRTLELAAPLLAALGGADLLLALAVSIDDADRP